MENLSFYSEYMEIKTMEYMTVKQAAEKWGLSERRLQTICNEFLWMQRSLLIKELSQGNILSSDFGTSVAR